MGQHLVAKCVTTAEPHERPPYWGLSIEKSTQRCALTFLFSRGRANLERHLVAKYVINAELQGYPPNWEEPIEGRHKMRSSLPIQPGTNDTGRHLVAKHVTNADPADTRPIWNHQPKSKTFAAKDRSLPNAHFKDLTYDQNRSVAFKNAYRYHSFHGWLE